MSILKVLKYPHPMLREQCEPVHAWDASLQNLIDDMTETMYAAPGAVGLAASQIGQTVRVVILDVTCKTTRNEYKVLINPNIVEASRKKQMREGCLSFPEYLASVKRATKLTFTAFDRAGALQTYTVQGLEAIAVQHEIDHLDGVLMIDRISSLKTDWIRRQPTGETVEALAANAPSGNVSAEVDNPTPLQAGVALGHPLPTDAAPIIYKPYP
jgi:peptide deformylase